MPALVVFERDRAAVFAPGHAAVGIRVLIERRVAIEALFRRHVEDDRVIEILLVAGFAIEDRRVLRLHLIGGRGLDEMHLPAIAGAPLEDRNLLRVRRPTE